MVTEAVRLKMLEQIIDAGAPFPVDEFALLSVGGQISLESRMRNELERLAGELGPEALNPLIVHLEGVLGAMVVSCMPEAVVSDMRGTVERLKRRMANIGDPGSAPP